jgi:hypothetical protein
MLLGEKLFWNVWAERFQYSILLRANTADAEWQWRKQVARPQKKASAGNQRWPNAPHEITGSQSLRLFLLLVLGRGFFLWRLRLGRAFLRGVLFSRRMRRVLGPRFGCRTSVLLARRSRGMRTRRRRRGSAGRLGPVRGRRSLPGRGRSARFLGRHGRSMIGRSGSLGAYHALSTEFAGTCRGGNRGRAMVFRGK